MPNFCLPPLNVDRFKQAIVKGEINPEELADLTSAERHKKLAQIVGEDNAKGVNALFESKLLLKNQKFAYATWAKKVAGISPEIRRDMIARIEKLDRVLDPADSEKFLNDLANVRLGYDVSEAEAKNIANLSQEISAAREAVSEGSPVASPERLRLGEAIHDLNEYTGELKNPSYSFGAAVKAPVQFIKDKSSEIKAQPGKAVTNAFGLSKSLKASLDASATFRQGWKSIFTNPKEWQRNVRKSFGDAVRGLKGEDVMRAINADVLSRPNFDLYKKAELAVSTVEEAFPSSIPEKIPGLGRAFKASEGAYTGFLHRQRADVFDKYLEIAEKNGVNIKDVDQIKSIAKLVNSLTGRGHLGGLEPSANTINSVFFSPRNLKANIDTLTGHQFQKGITPFVRKKAATDTLKIVMGTAGVLYLANALKPGSVEFDPRSADFGKVKEGNTRFDLTAGMSSILTLAARIASQSSKSTTTGQIKELGGGRGQTSGTDVLYQFLENKLSPGGAVIKDLIKQKDFNGDKPTVAGELGSLFTPLPITNYKELSEDPDSANTLLALISDGLGISTNTYGKSSVKWDNPNKELLQLKQKIGDSEFTKANKYYNDQYDGYVRANKSIQKMSPDDKAAALDVAKEYAKTTVYQKYSFKYKMPQAEKDAIKAKTKATREKNKHK